MSLFFDHDALINENDNDFQYLGCRFGRHVLIEKGVTFDVVGGFIGDRTIIRSGARVEGNSVVLGTESYIDHYARIGGGSCKDKGAFLNARDWFHMGEFSQVNIARGVECGEEVGVGVGSRIFTHGAYLPCDQGFPVQWAGVKIGHRVWLPHAWVNPGTQIGDNVVVAAMSLVNCNLPSGCLAGGIPVKVLKENAYPVEDHDAVARLGIKGISIKEVNRSEVVICGDTYFDIKGRTIEGPATEESERVKNQLRRNGIRFKFTAIEGEYRSWEEAYS